ncbi:MAG: phospholipase A [Desulforhopalus sp.]
MRGGETPRKMYCRQPFACLALPLLLAVTLLLPKGIAAVTLHECMSDALVTAKPTMTVADLQLQCEKAIAEGTLPKAETTDEGVVQERQRQDRRHILQPFTLMAHRPNYILPVTYNGAGYDSSLWDRIDDGRNWENTEAQFQVSLKFPLLVNLWDDTFDLYAAYTNTSFWQVYDSDSAPFRETNHQPEVWVQFHPNWEFWGFKNTWNSFGFNHQSNGQGGELSRSWNRLFAWITVERGNLAMSFRPWYRIPEDEEDDDNEDITDFLGHYELTASYKWKENVFSIMSRNNLESGFSKGAVELSWSFPLGDWPYLKGYLHYFTGYGQSLIEYDTYANTIGLGVSLTDWL